MIEGQQPHPAPAMVTAGPGPFITLRRVFHHGRLIVWNARQNRKGLIRAARALEHTSVPLWQTAAYNWLVGAVFALGSLLFVIGSALSLIPGGLGLDSSKIGVVFFVGSIPFTIAAYLQHFQSANAPSFSLDKPSSRPSRISLIGWQPRSPGWISTLAQFLGTLAFNLNTFNGIHTPSGWYLQDVRIWAPDMAGSLLFLISGYLALIETSHAYWSWRPRELAWKIVFINFLGCVFFMTAAVFAYVPAVPEAAWIAAVANTHLLLGALCFLVGSVLLARESRQAGHSA